MLTNYNYTGKFKMNDTCGFKKNNVYSFIICDSDEWNGGFDIYAKDKDGEEHYIHLSSEKSVKRYFDLGEKKKK